MTTASQPPPITQKRPRRKILPVVILLVIAALAFSGIYLLSGRKPEAKTGRGMNGPVVIATTTAQKGDIGDYIKRIGNVVPVYTASIFSQVTGVVKEVHFEEGQTIKKGDPLVDIDSSLYDATLKQAQGTLEKDQNVLLKDETDLARFEEAWKLNAIAKQILDDQRLLVEQDKGTVKNDQGTVDFDQAQVDYCYIKAPIVGRVGLRLVDPGNLVSAGSNAGGTPLAVITQMQPITVVFSITNDNLGAVLAQLKNNAQLTVDAYDSMDTKKLAAGKFVALDSQIDTSTGTVKVRALFDNEDLSLFPNQFVNAHLLVRTLTGVTLIPTATIQQNGQTSFVYVIEDNVAHVRNVTVGVVDDKQGITQVEGVNPGEVIADSSFDKLQDNTKVTVQSAAPAGGEKGKGRGGKGDASASPAADNGASPSPGASGSPAHRRRSADSGS